MTASVLATGLGLVGSGVVFRFDLRRRRLLLPDVAKNGLLLPPDMGCVAISVGIAIAMLVASPHRYGALGGVLAPPTLGILSCAILLLFLWPEGQRQVQLQRPAGIIFSECAILFGIYRIVAALVFHQNWDLAVGLQAVVPVAIGSAVLTWILPAFVRGREEHRILQGIALLGESFQPEYAVSTLECPFPERWQMLDAQSAEIEVLDFLKSLVTTVKPDLIVETGTFIGHSAMKMAEGLESNGFGRIITIEYDPEVFAKAKQNIDASGLGPWIEYRNGSSLNTEIDGQIDILYSDSDLAIRESEIRRFLPQMRPRGLVLVHDASSSFKTVREAALRLEKEGLLSVVLLSTPRGLVVAQKREGRT